MKIDRYICKCIERKEDEEKRKIECKWMRLWTSRTCRLSLSDMIVSHEFECKWRVSLVVQLNFSYHSNFSSCLFFSLVWSSSNQASLFLIFWSNYNRLFFAISMNVTCHEIALYFKEWHLPPIFTFSFSLRQMQQLFRASTDQLHPLTMTA